SGMAPVAAVVWCKTHGGSGEDVNSDAVWGKWVLARMIAALVLLVVAVIALGGCGSPSGRRSEGSAPATEQSQPIGPSKTVAQAAPDGSITGMPVDVEFTHFASPSGNIACVVTSSGDSEL